MKIKSVNSNPCKKCLQLSLPVNMMIRFARLVDPNYNMYARAGIKEGMPISNQAAAQRVVQDMIEGNRYVDFVEALVRIQAKGYMGRRYKLWGLDDIVKGVVDEGYSFDKVSGRFFENQRLRTTPNWGRLQEGEECKIAALSLDIADNSLLVKNNPRRKVEKAYDSLRDIVNRAVIGRLGRIWSWEGDGAVAAFLFGAKEEMAVFAGMEILNELFFYNRLGNPLDRPINLRIGAHAGDAVFSHNEMDRLKNETVAQAMALEEAAPANALSVPFNLYMNMDAVILDLFGPEKSLRGGKRRLYSIGLEK